MSLRVVVMVNHVISLLDMPEDSVTSDVWTVDVKTLLDQTNTEQSIYNVFVMTLVSDYVNDTSV